MRKPGAGGAASRACSEGPSRMPPPPSRLEIVLFLITGIVVALFSGGVVIYAYRLHLWD
jgi:hypothetical protein